MDAIVQATPTIHPPAVQLAWTQSFRRRPPFTHLTSRAFAKASHRPAPAVASREASRGQAHCSGVMHRADRAAGLSAQCSQCSGMMHRAKRAAHLDAFQRRRDCPRARSRPGGQPQAHPTP
eukprot:364041-Chlamydomonas_euryale.AAC.10